VEEHCPAACPVPVEIIGDRYEVEREGAIVIIVERKLSERGGNGANDLVSFMIVEYKIGGKYARILYVQGHVMIVAGVYCPEMFVVGQLIAPAVSYRECIGEINLYISYQWIKVCANGFGVDGNRWAIVYDEVPAVDARYTKGAEHPKAWKSLGFSISDVQMAACVELRGVLPFVLAYAADCAAQANEKLQSSISG